MWVINIQHWLDETKTAAAVPQLRSKVKKLAETVRVPAEVARSIKPVTADRVPQLN